MTQATQRRRIRYSSLDGLARGRLDYLQADLAAFGFTVENGLFSETVTFVNASDFVVSTLAQESHAVFFTTDNTLPAELESGVIYYLTAAGSTNFTISATPGGPAIDLTDDGTGTHTVWALPATTL